MDLRQIDLNLLFVLDVLLEERKVVSAAKRLGLSQPSTSAALDRCRKLFGDPLLFRASRGMDLTAKAEALRGPLRQLIEQTRQVLGAPQPELPSVTRVVRILCSDFPASALLAAIWTDLRESAPYIDLVMLSWRESEDVVDALARDQADIAITVLPQAGSGFRRTEIFRDRYCLAMRPNHPVMAKPDLDTWLSFPHLVVSAKGARHTPLDDQLATLGRRRRVAITVPSFLTVPGLLHNSDLVAMIPRGCKPLDPTLHFCEPPIEVEEFPLHLATANRSERDIAVQHVTDLIRRYFPR